MSQIEKLLDEGVGVFYEAKAKIAEQGEKIVSLELALSVLTQTIRQLLEARRSDREIMMKILAACTREGGGELAEAIKHMEASIGLMSADLRAIREAVVPKPEAKAEGDKGAAA
jgi:hypothetical protein